MSHSTKSSNRLALIAITSLLGACGGGTAEEATQAVQSSISKPTPAINNTQLSTPDISQAGETSTATPADITPNTNELTSITSASAEAGTVSSSESTPAETQAEAPAEIADTLPDTADPVDVTNNLPEVDAVDNDPIIVAESTIAIAGAGIKGPLAHADVSVYRLDTSFANFYDPQAPVATGYTNAQSEIEGLEIPESVTDSLVMVIDGSNATDLNTGTTPVVTQLITVISQEMLLSGRPSYATPMSTLAFHMAKEEAGMGAAAIAVENALSDAAKEISSTLGFGMSDSVNILSTPPIINEYTTTAAEQQLVAEHRAAIEAVAAILYEMSTPTGDGLVGEYFDSMDLTNLAFKQIDANVDFDWVEGTPDARLAVDGFSTRWSGFVKPEYSETYTFYTSSDDGVRLWVDGQLIIDNWTDHATMEDSATITLQADQRYAIKMEYFENWGDAVARLHWSSVSQAKQAIPQARLFSSDLPEQLDTNDLLRKLALDLQSDGVIDNVANGDVIGGINVAVATQSPTGIVVPNTNTPIANISAVLEAEQAYTNSTTPLLTDVIVLNLKAMEPNQDVDNDGILNIDDAVNDNIVPPTLSLSLNNIDFGSHDIGMSSNSTAVTLSNSGTSALSLASITASGDFIQSNNCGGQITATGSCTVDVTFTASAEGIANGTLTIVNGDANDVQTITLSGTGNAAASLTPTGPIVIDGDSNVVISGVHITNPNGHCIDIRNYSSNITIENSEIGPCRDGGINISRSHSIIVRNNDIHDTGWMGIYSNEAHTILVDDNRMERVASGYAAHANRIDGVFGPITFTNNYVKNVIRNFDWPAAGGNCLGLAYVEEASVRLNDNTCFNVQGESDPEDIFNIYWSRGLASDPIQIMRNKIQGGGPSPSGGGIIVGDGGGANTIVDGNILVDPGQYGVAVAGGNNHTLTNNKVYAREQSFTNVGIYVWRQNPSEYNTTQPGTCYDIHVEHNEVNWMSGISGTLNPSWNPSTGSDGATNCGSVQGWNNNIWYSNTIFEI